MNARQGFIAYNKGQWKMKAIEKEYRSLFMSSEGASSKLAKLDEEYQILKNDLDNLDRSHSYQSPRIILRTIIKDEEINISGLAQELGVSVVELDAAIEFNWNTTTLKALEHFGLPLEPFAKFIGEPA